MMKFYKRYCFLTIELKNRLKKTSTPQFSLGEGPYLLVSLTLSSLHFNTELEMYF